MDDGTFFIVRSTETGSRTVTGREGFYLGLGLTAGVKRGDCLIDFLVRGWCFVDWA